MIMYVLLCCFRFNKNFSYERDINRNLVIMTAAYYIKVGEPPVDT